MAYLLVAKFEIKILSLSALRCSLGTELMKRTYLF